MQTEGRNCFSESSAIRSKYNRAETAGEYAGQRGRVPRATTRPTQTLCAVPEGTVLLIRTIVIAKGATRSYPLTDECIDKHAQYYDLCTLLDYFSGLTRVVFARIKSVKVKVVLKSIFYLYAFFPCFDLSTLNKIN